MQSSARRLTLDTLIYGIGGSAARAVSIAFVPVFTRIFSRSEYGAVDVLTTLGVLVSTIALAGTNTAVFYFYRRTEDPRERTRLAGTAAAVVLSISSVAALAGIALARPIADLVLVDPSFTPAVVATALWVPANVAAWSATDLLRLEFRAAAYSVLGLGRTFLGSLVGVLLVVGGAGVEGLIASQAAFAAAAAAIAYWLTRHSWAPHFDARLARTVLIFGIPLVPAGIAYWVMAYVDRFVLVQFHGLAAAGIYAIANKLSQLAELVITAFFAAWAPLAYAWAREPGHQRLFARVFRAYVVGISWVAASLGLLAREALLIATTPDFAGAYPFVGLLAFGAVVNACYQFFAIGVALSAKTWHIAWTSALAAGLNVALNVLLIPPFALLGAAVGTLLSHAASAVLVYAVASRRYPIPYDFRAPATMAFLCGLALAGGLSLDSMLSPAQLNIGVTLIKAALVVALLALAWRLGDISPRQVVSHLRSSGPPPATDSARPL